MSFANADQAISAVEIVSARERSHLHPPFHVQRRRPGRIGKRDTARNLQLIMDGLDDYQVEQVLLSPWERLPDEPFQAFQAFDAFRSLGAKRTMAAAAHAVNLLGDTGRYNHAFSIWASYWAWVERAGAWDNYLARLAREQAEREMLRRQQDVIEAQRQAGHLLREKGIEFLTRIGLATGAEAIRAISEGVKLERTAEGLPDWVLEVIGASDADLLARYETLKGTLDAERRALPSGED